MKKLFIATILMVTIIFSIGCSAAKPDAGHETVLIMKPIIFGHGGVSSETVKTGLEFIALTTSEVDVNMQPLQFPERFDDLMSSDGVPLDFDATIRLQITDAARLIKEFGPEWYKNNVEVEFRNRVRQAVRKHGMNETAISTKAIDDIDTEVSQSVEKYLTDAKIPVRLIQMTVGRANPPDSIKDQRVATASQQQRILTEQQRKLAEDARKAAENSRAEADNTFRNAMNMSPEQYLRLESIKMQRDVCAHTKDKDSSCTFIIGDAKVAPIVNSGK